MWLRMYSVELMYPYGRGLTMKLVKEARVKGDVKVFDDLIIHIRIEEALVVMCTM